MVFSCVVYSSQTVMTNFETYISKQKRGSFNFFVKDKTKEKWNGMEYKQPILKGYRARYSGQLNESRYAKCLVRYGDEIERKTVSLRNNQSITLE